MNKSSANGTPVGGAKIQAKGRLVRWNFEDVQFLEAQTSSSPILTVSKKLLYEFKPLNALTECQNFYKQNQIHFI